MNRYEIQKAVSKHYTGEFFDLVCDGIEDSYLCEPFEIDNDSVLCALQDVKENNHLAGVA